jgi:hypothetical protein
MDMDPYGGRGKGIGGGGYTPSSAAITIPRSAASAAVSAQGPAAAAATASSKLAGLQRLKEGSAARLASRIPSANGRSGAHKGTCAASSILRSYYEDAHSPPLGLPCGPEVRSVELTAQPPARADLAGAIGGYTPSSAAQQPPTRALPGRVGGSASGEARGAAPSARPSSGRSTSTGPAMGATSRPNAAAAPPALGRAGSGRAGAGPPGPSGPAGYAGGGGRAAAAPSSGYGRPGPAPAPHEAGLGRPPSGRSAAAPPSSSGYGMAAAPRQPAVPAPSRRAAAPPAVSPAQPSYGYDDDGRSAVAGGSGFGGGGAAFAGSIPPGAEEAGPSGPMVECHSCGRRFVESAYAKHAKICEKVFAQKRKPVNMAAKRLEGARRGAACPCAWRATRAAAGPPSTRAHYSDLLGPACCAPARHSCCRMRVTALCLPCRAGSEAAKFFDVRKGVPKSEAKAAAPGPAARGGRGAGPGARLDERPLPGVRVGAGRRGAQPRGALSGGGCEARAGSGVWAAGRDGVSVRLPPPPGRRRPSGSSRASSCAPPWPPTATSRRRRPRARTSG